MKPLKKLGFEIGYLALLTRERIKPLSRWESHFSPGQVKALNKLGLRTGTAERKLANGKTLTELIFSRSSRYVDFYTRKFHGTTLFRDPLSVTTEGFLFGYPSCCVRSFVDNGYIGNDTVNADQKILFHWACPDCRVTPTLLPYYRRIHRECQQIFSPQKPSVSQMVKQTFPAAALSLLFTLIPGRARADDPHWHSPSAIDTTGDFLENHEEILLGTAWGGFWGGLPSGPREAPGYATFISTLPTTPSDTCCYRTELAMDGIENCLVCGQEMNMGGWEIHNPMRADTLFLPNMALHYMENGSFSFDGTTNAGRVDIEHLKSIFAHYDTDHYAITTSNDADEDGLGDDQESHFGAQTGDPDSDDNRLVDGAQVAEQLLHTIAQLPIADSPGTAPDDVPHLYFDVVYGIEDCDICGMTINMGDAVIVNPLIGASMRFPIIGLHYLAHGRFAYSGDIHTGEINAIELSNVLDIETGLPHGQPQPHEYQLKLSNYPNPFNAGTRIAFHLPKAGRTALRIYNINGQQVRTLISDQRNAGDHHIAWNGQDDRGQSVASGVYFCRLEYGGVMHAVKMVLVK
jgi:hypothetical protein